jgi:hypothetical protein
MTIILDLKPETEALLRESAARAGVEAADYARRLIEAGLTAQPMTGAEALAYWDREGVRGVFADAPDSPEFARQLRVQEEMRSWRTPPEETESSP